MKSKTLFALCQRETTMQTIRNNYHKTSSNLEIEWLICEKLMIDLEKLTTQTISLDNNLSRQL